MNYSINLDHERKIVFYKHEGKINREDIGKVWYEILQLKEFTEQSYDLISDYRDAQFNFSVEIENIQIIDNFFNSIGGILNGKKEAVILDDPHSTAISMLFQNKYENTIGFSIKVFSTTEAAYWWIKKN